MSEDVKKTAYRQNPDARVTADFVREVLDYAQDTGEFVWRARTPGDYYDEHACKALNARDAGKVAGSAAPNNYLRVQLLGSKYLLHRLAWLHVHGHWPDGEVDHIDGNPRNNALSNLRVVSMAENRKNAARRVDNRSGVTGVRWEATSGKWHACIRHNKRLLQLGRHACFARAVAARRAAERLYGFHVNHGKRERMTQLPNSSAGR